MLLIILLLSLLASSKAQRPLDSETFQQVINSTKLINSNQILQLLQNISEQVGVGTVTNVSSYLIGKPATLMTYAEITVNAALTTNVRQGQVIIAKYYGGRIGNISAFPEKLWISFKNDTVKLPSRYDLSTCTKVLFFINQTTNYLNGYLPYVDSQSTSTVPIKLRNDHSEASTLSYETEPSQMSTLTYDTQPSTYVNEIAGYGFAWGGTQIHDWSQLPLVYNIDPDGCHDVLLDLEFDAIRSSFNSWEVVYQSGLSFTEGDYHDYTSVSNYSPIVPDGYAVIGWLENDFPDSTAIALTWPKLDAYDNLVESDTALNGDLRWSLTPSYFENQYDVQSVVTHEIGHWLSLVDLTMSGDEDQTMWWTMWPGATNGRTLEWGDCNGAHYLYPVHDDAGLGSDAPNTFNEPGIVQPNEHYNARLCHTCNEYDPQDCYKFLGHDGLGVAIWLWSPTNANLDMELYDPNGNLFASSTLGIGYIDRIIDYLDMDGYWQLRIYSDEEGREAYGHYQFQIDTGEYWVSSILWASSISGSGGTWNSAGMIGSGGDGNYAAVYGYYSGDASAIAGRFNHEISVSNDIYVCGYVPEGYPAHIIVYVSADNQYYQYVGDLFVENTSPELRYFGRVTGTYNFIYVTFWADTGGYYPGAFYIDYAIARSAW